MNTRNSIILAAIMLFTTSVFAQQSPDTTVYTKKIMQAAETKRTGATITILGGIALVTGMLIAQSSDLNTGAGIGLAGLVTTGIGIPIWIIGGANHRKYTKRAQALTVQLSPDPHQRGLSLKFRF